MASLQKRNDTGAYALQFENRHSVRKTISLGRIPKRDAETIKRHCEDLVHAQLSASSPDRMTSIWVGEVGDRLRKKLARAGLIDSCKNSNLGDFIDDYKKDRQADPKIKASTIKAAESTHKSLISFFGSKASLRTITKGDAKQWRTSISKGKAENTVRKSTRMAKTLFNAAKDHKLIDENPFEDLAGVNIESRDREYFVTVEESNRVLDACPTNEWRLIFALARYGGLRCPSELRQLRWGDILWDRERMVIHSVKVEHHAGHGVRHVPLFPELMPHLTQAFDAAPDGAERVITQLRPGATNLRTQFSRIITRAGIAPWPKLFQNLRATRATEIARQFGEVKESKWMGHSRKIAAKHYLQITDDDYAKAAKNFTAPFTAEGAVNELHRVEAE